MTERVHNIVVGLTALAGLTGVAVLLLLFGYVPRWAERGYEVRVLLATASGLSEGSRVKLSGLDIGRVVSVGFQEPPQRGVVVTTLIRSDVRVPQAVRCRAESPLLGGSPTLAFEPQRLDEEAPLEYLPTDGSAVIEGEALTLVSQLAGELQAAMSGPAMDFSRMADSFNRLSEKWVQVANSLNKLIEQRSVADVDAGNAMGNLATVLARADQRLVELQGVIEGLNQWAGSAELRGDVFTTAANLKQLTEKLNGTIERANQLMDRAAVDIDRLTDQYVAVADELAGTIRSTRLMVEDVREGEGTVSKFLNDPALYDNLNDSARRLQAVLDEIQLLIRKWKAEGLPIQF